jgi:outer membrane protein OmpA-like peptidoglycan-associated protein
MKKLICLLGMTACIFTVYAQSASNESLFIIFSPNSAELQAVSPEQAIYNSQAFTSVAQLLLDNPKYRILIDGHANPVKRTFSEEKEQLKPLSEQRAEAAANFLIEYFRVDRYRLILTGAGGRFPSETEDPSLNRRVSFIIIEDQ